MHRSSKLDAPLPGALQHATEGEKADWYFGDDDEALARFEQALNAGTLEAVRGDSAINQAAIIYLPVDEMALASQQAKALGLDTARYLESVVLKAIRQKTAA